MQPATVENVAGQRMLRLTEAQALRLKTFPAWRLVSGNAKRFFFLVALFVVMTPLAVARYRLAEADTYFNHGLKLYYQGRYEEAIRQYQQSLRLRPAYSGAYDNMGLCLEKEGHRAQAIALYRQALVLDTNSSYAHSNLGKLLFSQGNQRVGLAELRTAVRDNPNDAHSHNMLGTALYRSGDKTQARQEWRTALRLGDQLASQNLQKFGNR